jgi:hypothetical protein
LPEVPVRQFGDRSGDPTLVTKGSVGARLGVMRAAGHG